VPVARSDAVGYLTGQFGSGANALLTLASVLTTDTSGGLKEPIDEAVMLAGGSYDSLATGVEGALAPTYFAALRYTCLKRILAGLNAKTNMDVGAGQGLTLKGNQLVEKVERLIALAQMELQAFGIDVTVTGGGWPGIANYSLDFLEPMEESL
jgi:hypothetical protein